MKLQLDSDGHAVLRNGKPVYQTDDGKEVEFDAPSTVATIGRLNAEAKTHRERAEAAEARLKPLESITDPAAALRALQVVKNLDDKKLVDAGEVEKVKEEATKALEAKYAPVVAERDSLKQAIRAEKIGGSFARSKLIAEKFAIPADMVEARFGSAFDMDGNNVIAKDKAGNVIYSPSRPGEPANFDEAIEALVGAYPYRDQILKGSGASGSGAGASHQGAGGKKTVTRAQFNAMDPVQQRAVGLEASQGKAVLTD